MKEKESGSHNIFDNLTSFWQLDILFIIWHMGNRTHGQWKIMVNTLDRDGAPWGWGTWVMGTWNFWDPMILWGSMKNSKKNVKMSKRCQNVKKDVKMSKRCQMSKSQTHRLWRRFTKKINSHNEVHTYWHQFWHQIWRSPKLFKNTFYAHFESFRSPSYVTSKLISVCVNLIMSIYFFCEPPP